MEWTVDKYEYVLQALEARSEPSDQMRQFKAMLTHEVVVAKNTLMQGTVEVAGPEEKEPLKAVEGKK